MYPKITLSTIKTWLITAYSIDSVLSLASYLTGFYSLRTHKASVHQYFTYCVLATIFTRILVSYLNVLNLLVFVMKIVVYLYSRFVLSLLFTVLLVPSNKQIGR
jgi:hypothetical protein